jgi:hypothetical protein
LKWERKNGEDVDCRLFASGEINSYYELNRVHDEEITTICRDQCDINKFFRTVSKDSEQSYCSKDVVESQANEERTMTIRVKEAICQRQGQGGKKIKSEKKIPLYYKEWVLAENKTTTKAIVPLASISICPPRLDAHLGFTLFFASFGLIAYIKKKLG